MKATETNECDSVTAARFMMFDPTHWYGSGPRRSLHLSALTAPIFPLHVRGCGGHWRGRLGAG